MGKEVLLILQPWSPPESYLKSLSDISPGIRVITYKTTMYAKEVPKEISDETWSEVTVLFTWNLLPTKEQAPNLRYVQLLSAGCNQILGKPIFEETKIDFCTSNGVHPYVVPWVSRAL